jgi:hypothetical protein
MRGLFVGYVEFPRMEHSAHISRVDGWLKMMSDYDGPFILSGKTAGSLPPLRDVFLADRKLNHTRYHSSSLGPSSIDNTIIDSLW